MMVGTAALTAAVIAAMVLLVGERRPSAPLVTPGGPAEREMIPRGSRGGEAERATPPARVQPPRAEREAAPVPARRLGFRAQDPLAGQPEAEAHPNRAEIRPRAAVFVQAGPAFLAGAGRS